MKYIIMKKSRYTPNPTAEWGYRGPTCKAAGVEPGKVYETIEEAQQDADTLGKFNPVGFQPVEMTENDTN